MGERERRVRPDPAGTGRGADLDRLAERHHRRHRVDMAPGAVGVAVVELVGAGADRLGPRPGGPLHAGQEGGGITGQRAAETAARGLVQQRPVEVLARRPGRCRLPSATRPRSGRTPGSRATRPGCSAAWSGPPYREHEVFGVLTVAGCQAEDAAELVEEWQAVNSTAMQANDAQAATCPGLGAVQSSPHDVQPFQCDRRLGASHVTSTTRAAPPWLEED